jgi:hypothetical protein
MLEDISPKVMRPACALVAAGGALALVGAALDHDRLRDAGAVLIAGAAVAAATGWQATDPQREPFIEPGFWELEPDVVAA